MGKTLIQWTDTTWNPTTGCTRVSEGCRNCYIERTPAFRMHGRKFVNGSTGVLLHPDRLKQPLHWRKPRRVFVNSLSDLFHEDVPESFLDRVFKVMVQAKAHSFQILTKRPQRMRDYLSRFKPDGEGYVTRDGKPAMGEPGIGPIFADNRWPPPHIWLGVSVEDQATADERIPILLQTPAAVRWISAEPLLGPVDLSRWLPIRQVTANALYERNGRPALIDWVVVGGESGPRARPCDLAWIRSIKDQCHIAGVSCFVKQLGANARTNGIAGYDDSMERVVLKDKKGGLIDEWPTDLQRRRRRNVP